MLTKQEAKTKWCPMALNRVIKYDRGTDVWQDARCNPDKYVTVNCIDDECACWVWSDEYKTHGWCGLINK